MNSMRPKKRFGGFSFYLILMLVIFAMTYFMSNMSGGKGYTLSEVRSLIENEKVESVVINGSSLKMVMKSVNGQPQEVITKEIPLESIGDYEKYLAESADKGLIKSYDYNRPTDISSILNILIIVMLLASIGVFIYINYSRQAMARVLSASARAGPSSLIPARIKSHLPMWPARRKRRKNCRR